MVRPRPGNAGRNRRGRPRRNRRIDDVVLSGTPAATNPTFSDWLAGYTLGGLTAVGDDADHDGVANGIENVLGTAPDVATPGLTLVSSNGSVIVFRHSRSNSIASDLTASYEWSADLQSWHASATAESGTTVTIAAATITDVSAPANDLVEVTATLTGTAKPETFVRLKAIKP